MLHLDEDYKTPVMKFRNLLMTICVAALPALFLSSCSKTNGNYVSKTPVTGIALIQASPDAPPLDVFINNALVTSTPINYGQSFGYTTFDAGSDAIRLTNHATLKTILADTVQFNQNTTYSLFIANTANNPQFFLLTDTLAEPATGNASVRFVDLSPDAPAVDLVIKSGATIASNRIFKGYSSFAPLAGNTFYTFEVHLAGTVTVLASTASIKINAGSVYTIWFHGLVESTNSSDKVAVDIFNN